MSGLRAFLELMGSGVELDREAELEPPTRALIDLLNYAEANDGLAIDAPWRLARSESRALTDGIGYTPPGTWAGLVGLAAGAGLLEAKFDGFVPLAKPGELPAGRAAAWRRIVEGFTRALAPPSAAATLLVLLGMHPLWGLRVAEEADPAGRRRCTPRSVELPEGHLRAAESAVFGAISGIFAALRRLEPDQTYPIDALCPVIFEACRVARRSAEEMAGERTSVVELFLPPELHTHEPGPRVRGMVTNDLFDDVLIPAGAARRFDDGRFVVEPRALDDVRVGMLSIDEQDHWLGAMTGTEPRFLVA